LEGTVKGRGWVRLEASPRFEVSEFYFHRINIATLTQAVEDSSEISLALFARGEGDLAGEIQLKVEVFPSRFRQYRLRKGVLTVTWTPTGSDAMGSLEPYGY